MALIVLENVVISFPVLFTPKVIQGYKMDPRFSANFRLPQGFNMSVFQELAKFCTANGVDLNQQVASGESSIRRIDAKYSPDYEGQLEVAAYARMDKQPQVLDCDGVTRITALRASEIYSGCIVNAVVSFYFSKASPGRMNCGLEGIHLVDNDPSRVKRLDNTPNVAAIFKPLVGVTPAPLRNVFGPATTPAPTQAAPQPTNPVVPNFLL